jgi:hypothetical protein
MRRLELIIKQIRRQTENEEFDSFVGISDEEFIQYVNDAQNNLQAKIIQQHPRVFIKEKIIDAVSGQESYTLPIDCFLNNKVHNVEYSPTGDEDDYYVLQEDTIKSRNPGVTGSPVKYIRMSAKLLMVPYPQSSGKIRLNYVERLRSLDKRRAQLGEEAASGYVTLNADGTNQTLNLDESILDVDTDSIGENDYVCIVDSKGNQLATALEVVSCNSSQLVVKSTSDTVSVSSQVPKGSYIVLGPDASTHSELDETVERYLISYCAWKILKRDSSVDSQEATLELTEMLREIVASYAIISDDVQFIPQLNSWDDWSV